MAHHLDPIPLVVRDDAHPRDRRDRCSSRVRPDRWAGEAWPGINYSDSLCFGTPLRRCSIQ
ncbi:hypothetical protein NG2371_02108 [Nocardia gamkensis]|nr:hypothetical protein [Nocardia gamkensis]